MRTLRLTALALLSWPSLADAQQSAGQVTVPIRIAVRPVLAIRGVVPAPTRTEAALRRESATIVHVESNLPYRLTVRLATPATPGSTRVLVQRADGAFEQLVGGAALTTAVGRAGQRSHEVVCRVETDGSDPAADRCPLTYELSAEHHDSLIRSIAR
jgi:hypothetical protein